jgi:hypothetical protein
LVRLFLAGRGSEVASAAWGHHTICSKSYAKELTLETEHERHSESNARLLISASGEEEVPIRVTRDEREAAPGFFAEGLVKDDARGLELEVERLGVVKCD